MNYLHASCPSGDPSFLWLVNLQTPRVMLSIYNTAWTSPRPGRPLLMSGENVVGDGNFHGSSWSRSSGWTSFGEDEFEEQSLGAVGLTEMMACKQHRWRMSLSLPQGACAWLSGTVFSLNGCPAGIFSLGRLWLDFCLVSPCFAMWLWQKQQSRGDGAMGLCPASSPCLAWLSPQQLKTWLCFLVWLERSSSPLVWCLLPDCWSMRLWSDITINFQLTCVTWWREQQVWLSCGNWVPGSRVGCCGPGVGAALNPVLVVLVLLSLYPGLQLDPLTHDDAYRAVVLF